MGATFKHITRSFYDRKARQGYTHEQILRMIPERHHKHVKPRYMKDGNGQKLSRGDLIGHPVTGRPVARVIKLNHTSGSVILHDVDDHRIEVSAGSVFKTDRIPKDSKIVHDSIDHLKAFFKTPIPQIIRDLRKRL